MVTMRATTTQWKKRLKHIEKVKYHLTSLVMLQPNASNGLQQVSYVDCNHVERETIDFLREKNDSCGIEHKGQLSHTDLQKIIDELLNSRGVEKGIKRILKKHKS